jgi:hypothetical protein
MLGRVTALAAAVLLALPAMALGATIDVEIRTDELTNNGDCSLREAAEAANLDNAAMQTEAGCTAGTGADAIDLDAGPDYPLTAALGGDLELTDPDGVTILGEGRATTVVDGMAANDRILEVISGQLTLNSTTIRNGTADAGGGGGILANGNPIALLAAGVVNNTQSSTTAGGGGISLADEATLTASGDTAINDNVSTGFGGGIYKVDDGNVTLNADVNVDGNDAVGRGGGIYLLGTNATLTLNGASVSNNDLTENASSLAIGSAIHSTNGTGFNFTNAQINGNDAVADTAIAAIEISSDSASTIESSTISGNTVTGQDNAVSGLIGAAAMRFNVSPGVTISNSTISQNMTIGGDNEDFSAGAGILTISPLKITGSTIASNTLGGTASSHFGAGLYVDFGPNAPTEILNSTFTGNVAPSAGGAIHVQQNNQLTIVQSTFSGNTSPQGQAINTQGAPTGGGVTLRGTIIDDGTGACSFGVPSGLIANSFNVDAGTSCIGMTDDTDFESTDAALGVLTDNGGQTHTMRLLGPAVLFNGAGTCTQLDGTTPLTVDQRGFTRPSEGACEPGAYERFICNGAELMQPGSFPGCPSTQPPSAAPQTPVSAPAAPKKKKCKKKRKKRGASAAAKKCKKKKRRK